MKKLNLKISLCLLIILNSVTCCYFIPSTNEKIFQSFLSKNGILLPLSMLVIYMGAASLIKLLQAKNEFLCVMISASNKQSELLERFTNSRYYCLKNKEKLTGQIYQTVEKIQSCTVSILVNIITVASTLFFSSVYIIQGSIVLFFLTLLVTIFMCAILLKSGKTLQAFMEEIVHIDNELLAHHWDFVSNKGVSPLLNYQKLFSNFKQLNVEKKDRTIRMNKAVFPVQYLKMLGSIIMTLLIALAGGILVSLGKMESANLFGIISVLPLLFSSLFLVPSLTSEYFRKKGMEKALMDTFSFIVSIQDENKGYIFAPEKLNVKNCSYLDILSNVNFNARKGQLTILWGDSGSGKTTLLRLILGLIPNDSGIIEYGDTDLRDIPTNSLRKGIFYMSANPYIHPTSLSDFLCGRNNPEEYSKLVTDLGLEELGTRPKLSLGTLSAGEIQKIFIAKMLLSERHVWICDEPTSNLDDSMEDIVMQKIADRVHKKGILAIFISHRKKTVNYADVTWKITKEKGIFKGKGEPE